VDAQGVPFVGTRLLSLAPLPPPPLALSRALPMNLRRLRLALLPLSVGALGCGESTVPTDPPAVAAGTYVLESVDGCALATPAEQCPFRRNPLHVDGTMVLGSNGQAARVIRYQLPGEASPRTDASVGTFTLRRGVVDFALREQIEEASRVWRFRATLADERLTVRYPHPADGETVEVFRRQ